MATRAPSLLPLALAALAAPAAAQDYPNRTIRFIVPFGAGGPTDVFTRALGEELRKALGQPIVMENRPGAGTIIGTTEVARAAPDGYTLLMISATQTTVETLNPNKSYRLMRDFVPVASLMNSELVLVVPQRSPVNSLKELIALAKAKPGNAQLRLLRPRLELSHGGRTHQKPRRARHRACALQGLDRRARRHRLRPDRHDVRQRADDGVDDRGRPREGARHLRQNALADPAERADYRGSRNSRLRRHDLDRRDGAGRHAEGDRRRCSTARSTRS